MVLICISLMLTDAEHFFLFFYFYFILFKKIFFKDFLYLFDRQRSQVGRETGRERRKQAPRRAGPDVGLNPRTLGP